MCNLEHTTHNRLYLSCCSLPEERRRKTKEEVQAESRRNAERMKTMSRTRSKNSLTGSMLSLRGSKQDLRGSKHDLRESSELEDLREAHEKSVTFVTL